jgi:phosphocarrier protein HPr
MSGKAHTREVRIQNRLGLHARASAQFVRTAGAFLSEITVTVGAQTVNAKSIMGLLLLSAGQGTIVRLTARGSDAEAALASLDDLVAARFGEPE